MVQATDIAVRIGQHLHSSQIQGQIPELQRSYKESDFAEIPGFMPRDVQDAARSELDELFRTAAKRRDLIIQQSGNTPRKYDNLDRDVLNKHSEVIPFVFRSPALYEFVENVVGEAVYPIPYIPEEFIASRLHKAGDVHGWHWDDYSWAIVWIFRVPDESIGGSLEYIPRVRWHRDDPRTAEIVARGPVLRRHPRAGSAYLLKAGTALHRVSPLREDAERMIVCYSFATADELTREVNHDSMAALYPESHVKHSG
ncbi:MAG: HalD/BesD family halogenase [Trebonia sp.]